MIAKYQVVIPKPVAKSIRKIPKPWQDKVINALEALQENPFIGERLWGKLAGKYKLRIWPYRIVYSINEKGFIVVVVNVGRRQGVYK